jgi:hypothetical protein
MGRKGSYKRYNTITGMPLNNFIADYGTLAFSIATALNDSDQKYKVKDVLELSYYYHTRYSKGEKYDKCKVYTFDVDIAGSEIDNIYIVDTDDGFEEDFFNSEDSICRIITIDFSPCYADVITVTQLANFFSSFRERIERAFSDNQYLDIADRYNLAYFTTFAFISKRFKVDKSIFLEMQPDMIKPYRAISEDNKVYENLTALINSRKNSEAMIYRCMEDGLNNVCPDNLLQARIVPGVQKSDD